MEGLSNIDAEGFRWPSGADMAIAGLSVRLSRLAEAAKLNLCSWEEDGLGPVHGALCRLPSGRVVLLREVEHAVEHLGASGPDIHADLQEVATEGIKPILSELLAALKLSTDAVAWSQGADVRESAAEILGHTHRYRSPPEDH